MAMQLVCFHTPIGISSYDVKFLLLFLFLTRYLFFPYKLNYKFFPYSLQLICLVSLEFELMLESEENHLDHMLGELKREDEKGKRKELSSTSDSIFL